MSMTKEHAEDCASCEGCAQYERELEAKDKRIAELESFLRALETGLEKLQGEIVILQLKLVNRESGLQLAGRMIDHLQKRH